MRSVRVAVAVSTIVIAGAIAVALSQTPLVVIGTNGGGISGNIDLAGNASSCQQVASIPQGTSAIRLPVGAGVGPWIRLRVLAGGRVVTRGGLPAGWGLEAAAAIPVARLSHEARDALVCAALGPSPTPIVVEGTRRPGVTEPRTLGDVDLRIEYLRPGAKSWWSLASLAAYRMGLGRALSGTWITFLAVSLMVAAGALTSRLALKELR